MTTTQSAPGVGRDGEAPAASQSGARSNFATLLMVIICAAVFLTALDQTVVVTALLPIATSFTIPFDGSHLPALSWVISGYLLGYVIVMPLMGRVSDLWGRQRVMIGCLALFAAGSLICANSLWLSGLIDLSFLSHAGINSPSPALTWLVIARFVQAVGGGAVVPVAIAAIGDLFGARRRILALGIVGGVTEAGGALGPPYGALILEKWHILPANFDQAWQWIFLINVPVVLLIVVALVVLWPKAATTEAKATGRIDWLGALILGAALLCASTGLNQQAGAFTSASSFQQTPGGGNNIGLLVAAIGLLGVFVIVESRRRDPVVALDIFRSGAFNAGAVFSLLLGMMLIIALVFIPIYIFDVVGTAAYVDAGLALLRLTVMIPIGAFGGGVLVSRFGCRVVGAAGAALTSAGFFVMHTWGPHVDWGWLTVGTMIAGAGLGLIVAPISTTALNSTAANRFGVAASVVTALRMVGMIFGLAGITSWGVVRFNQLVGNLKFPSDPSQQAAYFAAFTAAVTHVVTDFFFVGAVLALVAVIPALFLWQPKPGEGETPVVYTVGM